MTLFKIFLAVLFFNAFSFSACAESISEAASRISGAKEKKPNWKKNPSKPDNKFRISAI